MWAAGSRPQNPQIPASGKPLGVSSLKASRFLATRAAKENQLDPVDLASFQILGSRREEENSFSDVPHGQSLAHFALGGACQGPGSWRSWGAVPEASWPPFPNKFENKIKVLKVSRRKCESGVVVFKILLWPCLILEGTLHPKRLEGGCLHLLIHVPKWPQPGLQLDVSPLVPGHPQRTKVTHL